MNQSQIYLALYKGRRDGTGIQVQAARLTDWATRRLTRGIYSHCEIAVALDSGRFECYSASIRDGGVRRKTMPLPPDKWDLLPPARHLRPSESPVCPNPRPSLRLAGRAGCRFQNVRAG